jgi:hypothetical protein
MPRRRRAGDGEAVIERAAAVLVGMAAGYVSWLAGIAGLTVVVPMQHIVIAAGLFLGVMMIATFAIATHFKKSVRETLCRAGLLAGACPSRGSQHLLPHRLSELVRENSSMMKPDSTLGLALAETKNCCG